MCIDLVISLYVNNIRMHICIDTYIYIYTCVTYTYSLCATWATAFGLKTKATETWTCSLCKNCHQLSTIAGILSQVYCICLCLYTFQCLSCGLFLGAELRLKMLCAQGFLAFFPNKALQSLCLCQFIDLLGSG